MELNEMNFKKCFYKINSIFILGLVAGCTSISSRTTNPPKLTEIPFRYYENTFMVVPVSIDGAPLQEFIFDTGIGVNLISKSLCAQLKCQQTGQFTGKRMSGQALDIPMTSVASLAVGGRQQTNAPMGIFDVDSIISDKKIVGFLSLGFFKENPYTVDYDRQVIIFENDDSLKKLRSEGVSVPIQLDIQGPSLDVFLKLSLPQHQTAKVEVDTGSQELILDEHYMKSLKISKSDPKIHIKKGKDETAHGYVRYFTELNGEVGIPYSEQIRTKNPKVMFQKIIYEGLIGHEFMKQYKVSFNIPESEMIFTPKSH